MARWRAPSARAAAGLWRVPAAARLRRHRAPCIATRQANGPRLAPHAPAARASAAPSARPARPTCPSPNAPARLRPCVIQELPAIGPCTIAGVHRRRGPLAGASLRAWGVGRGARSGRGTRARAAHPRPRPRLMGCLPFMPHPRPRLPRLVAVHGAFFFGGRVGVVYRPHSVAFLPHGGPSWPPRPTM